ncbi:hypothetical protein PILCRDRAFT_826434 [Piloderma croceum F 1598]|uniref:DASH complex subunit SPC19 n=1 Tax=Piloderma croceum (strain F 1598) TaxID=765440 RepID=A0A0C3BGE4_PILCF|nr:hypothetical protein PILCRDRAFT_826434 [Piloderma croceum F 1598]
MSRLSTLPRGRDSVFAGGSEQYRGDTNAVCPPNLRECVLAMEDCCEEAHEAQQLLRNGTFDLPRITKVLDSQRVFLLVDEGTVRQYKADLTDEVEPQINELLERAEKGVKTLQKKESLMQTKVEAAQVAQSRPARTLIGTSASNKLEARRLQMLIKQRERLEEEMQALETEVDQLELKAMKS